MKILKCLIFFYISIFKIDAFSAVTYGVYGNKINNQEPPTQLLISENEFLSSPQDTAGPSFTLTQGTASNRVIGAIDNRYGGYYTTTDCSNPASGAVANTTGSSFTFTDNAPIYFGISALSALSNNQTNVQCIQLVLNQSTPFGSGGYAALKIRNLNCSSGTTCSGGNVCYVFFSRWTMSSTPAC